MDDNRQGVELGSVEFVRGRPGRRKSSWWTWTDKILSRWENPIMVLSAQLWERQPGESARAFQAFSYYRDLGPSRSTAKVGQKLGKSKDICDRWSSRWQWVERCRGWDAEQDQLTRQAQLEAIRDMAKRHAEEAMNLQAKALRRLQAMDPDELSPREVLAYYIQGAKLERLARGEPDNIGEQRVQASVDLLHRIGEYQDLFEKLEAEHESRSNGSIPGVHTACSCPTVTGRGEPPQGLRLDYLLTQDQEKRRSRRQGE